MNKFNDLIMEIRARGINIENIDDLIKISKKEKSLIPIILKYIKFFENEEDKAWLVRALGVKGFIDATKSLLEEFYNASNLSSLKWTIGNTISLILDNNCNEDIIRIIKNKDHGTSRQMFVVALGKMREKKALPIILEQLSDKDLTGHAIIALSYFNDQSIISYIEPFKNHEVNWIRKEAIKAIKKISSS